MLKKFDFDDERIKKFCLIPLIVLINIGLLVADYWNDYQPQQDRRLQTTATVETGPVRGSKTSAGVIKQIKMIATDEITEMSDGDYVLPIFSPDGRYLAFSKKLVEKDEDGQNFENTVILLYDTVLGENRVLLDANRAKNFAVNQVFVIEFNWLGRRKLQAVIGDGDIGATCLTFDVMSGKVIKTDYRESGETSALLEGDNKKTLVRTMKLFPQFDRGILDAVLRNSRIILSAQGLIYQKNIRGQDNHIWFLDFKKKTTVRLLKMPDNCHYAIKGGFCFGKDLIFLIEYASDCTSRLYRYHNGQIELLEEFKKSQSPLLMVKNQSHKGVFFLVRLAQSYGESQNPFYYYDGQSLAGISDYNHLYDVAVDCSAKKIAFCYWQDRQRKIVLKKVVQQQ